LLDIRRVREDAEGLRRALARRGGDHASAVDALAREDAAWRAAIGEVNELKARRNVVSEQVGTKKRNGEDASELIAEMSTVKARIAELDAFVAGAEERVRDVLLATPNTPLDEVPVGGEEANTVVKTWGSAPEFPFTPQPHWELGQKLGLLDLPGGARISGSGFPVLRGAGARLQRVLIDWFLDVHTTRHGYEELRVPYLVTSETATGTGQLPKFSEELYRLERDDLWLVPTAEVPVTNLHRGELLEADVLPVRYTAYSPCFRREAGAAGKDTRGLLRVHQFDKVELVRYERPENSRQALEELTAEAESLLEMLELPYRRVTLASGDLGFGAAMTYDLEVWAAGVARWLEVSSCSTFTDYQARRAGIRFRPAHGEKPELVHTLNGSALALPRVLAAILENNQQEDGSVNLPAVLHDRMGTDRLVPRT
jgi:seryl-tRNA synthetase